jgi:uncharacterized RDD family membrane protein YckC
VSVVTPEAVLLDFEQAGLGTRIPAILLDLLVQLALLIALGLIVGGFGAVGLSDAPGIILATIGLFLVLLGYPILCEAFWGGRTVGKAAAGLRVRTVEGAPIRFRHAAIRGALLLVDLYLTWGIAGTLSTLFSKRSQRLGDLAAGTIVLRERAAATHTSTAYTFYPPPGWEPYTEGLDVAAVTSEQYGLVRSFLLRANDLSPAARYQLALDLANPLSGVLHHQPPPGVQPEAFLRCLAAAYQRRQGQVAPPPPEPSPF